MKSIHIKDFLIGEEEPLTIMSGPCVIENEEHSLKSAEQLKKIFSNHPVNFIFKSSYDKANRSSIDAFRGPGLEKGLRILEHVKKEFDVPIVTDVHSPEEARAAGEVCDLIQIPAFLCRQTDLLIAAGESKAAVSIKKGQFMAPWDMGNVVEKIRSTGKEEIILIDRGTTFGYNNLVCDMRAIPIMQQYGFPVCFDATHAVQLPGGQGDSSGGQREFIPTLARSAIAAGANCLFMESHPDPAIAKCDGPSVLPFALWPELLPQLVELYQVMHKPRERVM